MNTLNIHLYECITVFHCLDGHLENIFGSHGSRRSTGHATGVSCWERREATNFKTVVKCACFL